MKNYESASNIKVEVEMKRWLLISIIGLLSVTLIGCRQENSIVEEIKIENEDTSKENESVNLDFEEEIMESLELTLLEFSSLEDFLGSYMAVTAGDIHGVIADWRISASDGEFADVIAETNFAGLEALYLPVNIPEDFHLHRITVHENFVSFHFFHKDDLISEEVRWEAEMFHRHFDFGFNRWDMDMDMLMDGMLQQTHATNADLIEGRYLFVYPHMLTWVSHGTRFTLYTPIPQDTNLEDVGAVRNTTGVTINNVEYSIEDMARFCSIQVINLLDRNEVLEWLTYLNTEEYDEKIFFNSN